MSLASVLYAGSCHRGGWLEATYVRHIDARGRIYSTLLTSHRDRAKLPRVLGLLGLLGASQPLPHEGSFRVAIESSDTTDLPIAKHF